MNEFEELIKNYNIKNKEDYDFLEKVKNIIERKDNIIKEVREYIESNPLVYIGDTDVKVEDILYQEKNIEDTKFFKTLFEILDKENK